MTLLEEEARIKLDVLQRLTGYVPSPGQRLFHLSVARFRAIFAASRFGKSMAAGYEVAWEAIAPWRLGQHASDRRIWFVAPTYDLGSKEFAWFWTAAHALAGKGAMEILEDVNKPDQGRMRMMLGVEGQVNGQVKACRHLVEVKSAENEASLLGEEIDMLVLCEGSQLNRETYFRYLVPRLGPRLGRVLVPTTPKGYNWLHNEFWLKAHPDCEPTDSLAKTRPDPYLYPELYQLWAARLCAAPPHENVDTFAEILTIYENPYYPRKEIEAMKKKLTEFEFREQYLGEFTRFSGSVFSQFNYLKHVLREIGSMG